MCGGVGQQDVGALAVRRERHVVDVAEAQKRIDVRLVRLGRQRVAQEDDVVDLADGDARADLLVAAERAGEHRLDAEAEGVVDQRAGRARRDQVELREEVLVVADELEHLALLLVVGNQGNRFHG